MDTSNSKVKSSSARLTNQSAGGIFSNANLLNISFLLNHAKTPD